MIQFDFVRFGETIRAKRGSRSLRECLPEINQFGDTSLSTLNRVERGNEPDMYTLEVLSAWAGVHPGLYFSEPTPNNAPPPDTMRQVETALREDGTLTRGEIDALLTLLASLLDGAEAKRVSTTQEALR